RHPNTPPRPPPQHTSTSSNTASTVSNASVSSAASHAVDTFTSAPLTTLTPVPTSANAVGGLQATPTMPQKTKIKRAVRSTAHVAFGRIQQLRNYSGLSLSRGLGKATSTDLGGLGICGGHGARGRAGTTVPVKTSKRNRLRFRRASSLSITSGSFKSGITEPPFSSSSLLSSSPSPSSSQNDDPNPFECIINVKNCPPLPPPGARLESGGGHRHVPRGWNKVDRIVVGNFVETSQAQRKWYTKVLGRMGGGEYGIRTNSVDVIVQNRPTGQLGEEKMQVYDRLEIILLYNVVSNPRRLLKLLSIKQGITYDDPEGAKEIPAFIEFHGLEADEILDPLNSFSAYLLSISTTAYHR
ncbi:hypothetical protein CVT25_004215, partial [Psilocybe cyanescens]